MVGLEENGGKEAGAAPGEGPVPAAGWRKKWNNLESGLSKEGGSCFFKILNY